MFEPVISSTQDFLVSSFDLNYLSEERFLPSLLPKWLYETTEARRRPDPIIKSDMTVLNLVCPDLKSFPASKAPCF